MAAQWQATLVGFWVNTKLLLCDKFSFPSIISKTHSHNQGTCLPVCVRSFSKALFKYTSNTHRHSSGIPIIVDSFLLEQRYCTAVFSKFVSRENTLPFVCSVRFSLFPSSFVYLRHCFQIPFTNRLSFVSDHFRRNWKLWLGLPLWSRYTPPRGRIFVCFSRVYGTWHVKF